MRTANEHSRREFIFWIFCIPVRLTLAFMMIIAQAYDLRPLQILLIVFTGTAGLRFFMNFLAKLLLEPIIQRQIKMLTARKDQKLQLEKQLYLLQHGGFGGEIWWQRQRLVHGTLFLLYSLTTLVEFEHSYYFGVVDVAYATLSGFLHYG